jgi:hypothetical protein
MSEHRWFYWCNACRCDHEAGAVRTCNPIAEPPPELRTPNAPNVARGRQPYAQTYAPHEVGKE